MFKERLTLIRSKLVTLQGVANVFVTSLLIVNGKRDISITRHTSYISLFLDHYLRGWPNENPAQDATASHENRYHQISEPESGHGRCGMLDQLTRDRWSDQPGQ